MSLSLVKLARVQVDSSGTNTYFSQSKMGAHSSKFKPI